MDVLGRPVRDLATASPSSRRRLRWGVLLVALVVVGAVVVAVRAWWPHDVFGPSGNVVSMPLEVGEVGLIGVFPDPDHAVRLLDVEPVLAEGSAPAAISFALCQSDRGIGAVSGPKVVASNCSGVGSIDTHPILRPLSVEGSPQLVAVVVPLTPGKVIVHGVRLTYRDDGLTRTEHTGVGFTVDATSLKP